MASNGIRYISCSLCGADDASLHFMAPVRKQHEGRFNRDQWEIVRCRRCGLIYSNPQPDAAALDYYYTFDNPQDSGFVQNWFIDNADLNRTNWQKILRAMNRFGAAGRLLDVGCGAGGFLVEAAQAGYTVTGQDVAPFFVSYCRDQLGLSMLEGPLETLALPGGSFDVVTAFDVIEHHPDPRQLLEEMRRLVCKGGLIVVGTHDIGNPFARLYGIRWRHIAPIGHLTYFSRHTLGKMLQASGFEVLHVAGAHTIDGSPAVEMRSGLIQFFRLIVLRSLILGIYKPVTARFPALTHWQVNLGGVHLNHEKLMIRAGSQVIMNDNMVFLGRAV